jgi:hypothetical protein
VAGLNIGLNAAVAGDIKALVEGLIIAIPLNRLGPPISGGNGDPLILLRLPWLPMLLVPLFMILPLFPKPSMLPLQNPIFRFEKEAENHKGQTRLEWHVLHNEHRVCPKMKARYDHTPYWIENLR